MVKVLLLSSFLELVFNRIFSRAGVFMPKEGFLVSLYNLFSSFGLLMFNLSSILVFIVLLLVIDSKLQRPNRMNMALTSLLSFLIILSIAFVFIPLPIGLFFIYSTSSLLAVLLIMVQIFIKMDKGIEKLAFATLGGVYLCSYYFQLSQISYQVFEKTTPPAYSVEVFNLGEFLVIPFSLLLFASFFRYLRSDTSGIKTAVFPTVLASLFLWANVINSKLMAIFVIWSLGFTLFLPYPLYAIALWLFSFTTTKLISEGSLKGYGLAFIFIAGYTFQLSYYTLLLLLGLLLLLEESP